MSLRGFGLQTLTGSAQPVFGTLTGSPISPSPDLRTGRLDAASAPSQAVVGVASAAIFRQGDHVMIGPLGDFSVQSPAHPPDGGVVSAVNYAGNTITVNNLRRQHNASEWAVLAIPCAQISIQNPAAGAVIDLGEDGTVSDTSPYLIDQIAAGTTFTAGGGVTDNVAETQHVWVKGTQNNTFLPSLLTI